MFCEKLGHIDETNTTTTTTRTTRRLREASTAMRSATAHVHSTGIIDKEQVFPPLPRGILCTYALQER